MTTQQYLFVLSAIWFTAGLVVAGIWALIGAHYKRQAPTPCNPPHTRFSVDDHIPLAHTHEYGFDPQCLVCTYIRDQAFKMPVGSYPLTEDGSK